MLKIKNIGIYAFINISLIVFILVATIYIYQIINNNKSQIAEFYDNSEDILVSTMQADRVDIENLNKTETIIVPLDDEKYSNAKAQITINKKEEYDFTKTKNNRYYYNQLTSNAKTIYDTIEKNLNYMKSGNYELSLPKEVAEVLNYEGGDERLDRDFQSAWDALYSDRMDIFFIDISKVSLKIKKTTRLNKVSYYLTIGAQGVEGYLANGITNEETVNKLLNEVEEARNQIINQCTGNTYENILKVHDWIIENLEYDIAIQNANIYNVYGALIGKSAVCQGYAEAFKYILDEMQIPTIMVTGEATNSEGITESHAWNYIQINGKWYAVDTTWDDPVVRGNGRLTKAMKHKYFLQGENTMNKSHRPNGQITENGQLFIYPYLELNEYNY